MQTNNSQNKDDSDSKSRVSLPEKSKASWDDQLKQEEEKNKATKERYKDKALQLLTGANALYNTGLKTDEWQNTLDMTTAATGAVLDVAGTNSPKEQPIPWYKKTWSGIKKVARAAFKAVTSNVGAIVLTTVALVGAIATGGLAPIIGGAVVLGLKVVKTGIDARNAINVRKLNKENDALVDYATQLAVRSQLLETEPRLRVVEGDLCKTGSGKASEQQLNFGTGTRIVRKIVGVLNSAADIAVGAITNPAQAACTIGVGIGNLVKDTIIEEVTRTPEVREQLRDLINNERKNGNTGYDNTQDLREQTRKLKIDNQALRETAKEIIHQNTEGKYVSLNEEEIKKTFLDKQQTITDNTPALQLEQEESAAKTVLKGIGDALNPYSEFNITQHSGLVTARRKEHLLQQIPVTETPQRCHSITGINSQDKKLAKELGFIETQVKTLSRIDQNQNFINDNKNKNHNGKHNDKVGIKI